METHSIVCEHGFARTILFVTTSFDNPGKFMFYTQCKGYIWIYIYVNVVCICIFMRFRFLLFKKRMF